MITILIVIGLLLLAMTVAGVLHVGKLFNKRDNHANS